VKDGEKCLTQKEIHGLGIPTSGSCSQKRTTDVQPFSFDERDKTFLKKKEENIKKVRFDHLLVDFIFKVEDYSMHFQ
jgi:hypothetical protein